MAETLGLKTIIDYRTVVGPPEVYTVIGQVASVQPPQPSRDVADVEDLNPTDAIKKKLPSLIDLGEVTMTINFDTEAAPHTALQDAFYAKTVGKYRIKLPTGSGWTFEAYVTGWAPQELGASDVVQAEVTFTITTKPTFGVIS